MSLDADKVQSKKLLLRRSNLHFPVFTATSVAVTVKNICEFLAYSKPIKKEISVMKLKLLLTLIIVLGFCGNAIAFEVKFADNAWNHEKIPAGQQCQKFGGNKPATPKLIVSGIPAGSNGIVLEYSDRASKRMNNGGHGKMQFALNSPDTKVEIPSVPGHSFDIPPEFTMIAAHRGPKWDKAGAYMPPCSGGKGHAYYVTVKSVKDDQVTAETVIEMGKY